MKTPPVIPSTLPQPSEAPRTPYQRPSVQDLGAWQAVTLNYSVPFNGSLFNPNLRSFNGVNDFDEDMDQTL